LELSGPDHWHLIQRGDQKAYEEAFRSWYRQLCLYALPIIRDKDEAEEVVQNVFYTIWAKRETLQVSGQLKSYLYRAVHNECLNKLKHEKVKAGYAADYKASNVSPSNTSYSIETKELGQEIRNALDSLPEQCGIVFRMNRFEEKKYAEIAAELNISIKTVETHMGKALKILRGKLGEYLHLLFFLLMIKR
jgi:RNA polymerase sigma-70 factor (ECF subfamily)